MGKNDTAAFEAHDDPIMSTRHAGSATNSVIAKLGIAARLTVKEPDKGSAHFARHVPVPPSPVGAPVRQSGAA